MPIELDIAGNFAKGQQATIQRRHSRQLEQAIDLELGDATDKQGSRRNLYELYERSQGRTPNTDYFQGLEDPFAFKFMDWWKQRRAARQPFVSKPGVPGTQGALPLNEIPGYADGGEVEKPRLNSDAEIRQRAAQARAQTPARVASSTQTVAPSAPAPKPSSWLSRMGRAGLKSLSRLPVIGAIAEIATPHTLGSGELSAEENARISALAPAAPPTDVVAAPDQALALDAEGAKTPLPQVQNQAAQEVPQEEGFDWSGVEAMPDEMPSMSVRDWVEYRSRAIGEMMRGGVSEKDAHDQITQMQHSGFMSLGQEALALLQAGDMQNAAKALKAAYQYFPNGSDVSFGIQGNNLIGMGKNEVDGKPNGKPMILNEERLAMMLQNFARPETFAAWTKDARDETFRQRMYSEITKPTAEANARANQTNAQANLLDAQSNAAYRAGGAGGTDPGPDDRRAMEAVYREELAAMAMTDEALAADPSGVPHLASVASQIRAQYPDTQQLPDNELLTLVMNAHKSGALDGIVQQFGLK